MAALSISRAWEETKGHIATDGRLMAIVAAALVVLPGLIVEVISPASIRTESSVRDSVLLLVSSLLQLIGQLAIIRLAIAPSVSVGEAIGHGSRRMPVYVVAAILLTVALIVAVIPFAVILYVSGVPLESGNEKAFLESPLALLVMCLFLALITYVGIRMLMSSPVASEEGVGAYRILRRSWDLTGGHWWRLFGFMLLFVIGALAALAAVNWAATTVAVLLLGSLDPMSASALVVGLADSIVNGAVTVLLAVMLARIYLQLAGRAPAASVPKSGT
jgi:hypothetical protein